ncbi:MAG: cytochrome C oxidase subunit IV family protein [Gammaproteobacteria bacterium]|nr:cytochrome C oxidase subunit IV family protein [Gammaproteobacteria bacterium]MBI5619278.1 cytochrome C oxidase subunit IV family protein [Gammaproteobacteria bacterium]
MSATRLHPMTLVWLALLGATALSFALAESAGAVRIASALVMLIAGFKVRLVFLYFMELGGGAMPWRAIAELWVAGVTTLIVVCYLMATG